MITESPIQFHPLTFVPDGDGIIVGRVGSNNFACFPLEGVVLLKQMQAGMTPQEASTWYQKQYHETIDMDDFLQTLQEMHFISQTKPPRKEPFSKREGRSPFSAGRVRLVRLTDSFQELAETSTKKDAFWRLVGRAFFSPLAWILYAGLFGYAVFLMVQHPYLFPNSQQIFFSPSYTVIELGLFVGEFPPILFHEWFHMLAGRSQGVRSRLGISRRLYFVVFETDLTELWRLPAKARYLPFLAGIIADILFFSLMIIIAGLTYVPGDPYSFPSAFCMAMAYSTVLRFFWQFFFYLRTDIYYVICTTLHCINLQETTQRSILNRFFCLIGRPDKMQDESLWPAQDRRAALWYAPVFLAGYAFSLGLFFFVGLPVTYRYLSGIFDHLLYSAPLSSEFWDTGIFLSLNMLQLSVVGFLIVRDMKRRKKGKRS